MTTNQKTVLAKPQTNNILAEKIAQQKQQQARIPVVGKTETVGDMRKPTVAKNVNKK